MSFRLIELLRAIEMGTIRSHEGTYDVCLNFGILDPLPPLVSTKSRNPPSFS